MTLATSHWPGTGERGALNMLRVFARAYPARSAWALIAMFAASLLDGLGISMLLSMLSVLSKTGAPPSAPQKIAMNLTGLIGIAPTPANLLLTAVVLISLKAVMALLSNRQVGYAVAFIATDLRLALIRAAMRSRWPHFVSQSVGRLSNAVAIEAQRSSEAFQWGAEMLAMMLIAAIYLCIAMSISWRVGLSTLVAGMLLLLLLRVLIRTSRRAGQSQTSLQSSLLGVISGQLLAAKPLKAMAREDHVDALLSEQTSKLEKALREQVISREALSALQEPILAIIVGCGFFLGIGILRMPMPEVIVMLFVLARSVGYLSKAQKAYQQVVVRESAYWAIHTSIEQATLEREPSGGTHDVRLTREIRFESVSFAHDGGRGSFLQQSFIIPGQGLTVLWGPSGAGKTTLLDLVVGLLSPSEGKILVDGVPLNEINLRAWRRQIGYVPQDSAMVDGSVAYNVTLGEPLSDDAIRAALRAADAMEFVEAMPEGLNTRVGESGALLSGGQRQRLAIARALIHEPSLLILDEATSNLDPESQAAVLETVKHLKGRLAILAVAHQASMLQIADRVLRVAGGQVLPHESARSHPLHV